MAPKLTLVYFNNNVRARTECARMSLAYGAVPHTFADCQTYFGCSFPEAKKNGKLPFGQLPILAIDDKVIAQSGAIDRFAASQVKTPGFVPADPVTKAMCDMVYDTHHDLFKIMPLVNLWSGEKWQQEKDEFFNNTFPARLPALVKMLGEKQYFCGNFVTYGDFAMYNIMDLVRLVEPEALKAHTNILAWMARIECLPGVKDYLAGRPECVGIGTNPGNKVDGKIVPKF